MANPKKKKPQRPKTPGTLQNAATRVPHAYADEQALKGGTELYGKIPSPRGKTPGIIYGGYLAVLDLVNGRVTESPLTNFSAGVGNVITLAGLGVAQGDFLRSGILDKIYDEFIWTPTQAGGLALPQGRVVIRFLVDNAAVSTWLPVNSQIINPGGAPSQFTALVIPYMAYWKIRFNGFEIFNNVAAQVSGPAFVAVAPASWMGNGPILPRTV